MIDPTFPLVDLHRHLEGSVRLETILDLGLRHNLPLPALEVDGMRPFVQVTTPEPGVMEFIAKFKWTIGVMVNSDACRRIAYESVEDAKAEGIDYLELRFSPLYMAEPNELNPEAVVEAVIDGAQAAQRDSGILVNLIGILSRTYGPRIAVKELEALLHHRDRLVGLDLAGDEAHYPGEEFVEHFHRAREAGLQITVHAGEADGPHSIWQAVQDLGARRIGHAVHAPQDPVLLDFMAQNRVGVEANLTSNVQTSTVPDYPSHPLRLFLEHGLLATINTDDPGISSIDLPYEYEVAAPAAGLSPAQIQQAQRNALEVAFLTEDMKWKLRGKKIPKDTV